MYVYDMRTNADVPVVPIDRAELQPGDFVGTLHGIAVWEVVNVSQFQEWASLSTRLISSYDPDKVGTAHTLTISSASSLARCYRPLTLKD